MKHPVPILLRTEAHPKMGLGHYYRMLHLGERLRHVAEMKVYMAMSQGAWQLVQGRPLLDGIEPVVLPRGDCWGKRSATQRPDTATLQCVATLAPAVVVCDLLEPDASDEDLHSDPSVPLFDVSATLQALMRTSSRLVVFSDQMSRMELPGHLRVNAAWQGHHSETAGEAGDDALGPAYYMLSEALQPHADAALKEPPRPLQPPAQATATHAELLLSFGGTDVDNLAARCLDAVVEHNAAKLSQVAVMLTNPAAQAQPLWQYYAQQGLRLWTDENLRAQRMAAATVALTHGGNTLFEFAALGVPTIAIARRERQAQNAQAFARAGAALYLGHGDQVDDVLLAGTVKRLLANQALQRTMADAGRRYVDGAGGMRVQQLVLEQLALHQQERP